MTVYERVEELRKEKGISQGKLEKELGLSNGLISKWKDRIPSSGSLKKVADYFGTSINYLLTGEELPDQPVYYFNGETAMMAQKLFEDRDLRVLFDAAQDADPADVRIVTDILNTLKNREKGNDDTGC